LAGFVPDECQNPGAEQLLRRAVTADAESKMNGAIGRCLQPAVGRFVAGRLHLIELDLIELGAGGYECSSGHGGEHDPAAQRRRR
jgi:hypothetical protein